MIASSSNSIFHDMPKDLHRAMQGSDDAQKTWQTISDIARNEWICWVISVKQQSTRDKHVIRAIDELAAGKKRPCCWIGCVHRTDKEISPSVRAILKLDEDS